jgi:hypothetical protein
MEGAGVGHEECLFATAALHPIYWRPHEVSCSCCSSLSCLGWWSCCCSRLWPQRAGRRYSLFSNIINWELTGDVVFTVRGAPPNVCGNLVTTRNGSLLCGPGWICTDANGNATANAGGTSSWSWANTPNDQTDTNLHFNWPPLAAASVLLRGMHKNLQSLVFHWDLPSD